MRNSVDRFRKRHNSRKMNRIPYQQHHKRKDKEGIKAFEQKNDRIHPLFSKEAFIIKIFISITLFLSVAILFKQPEDELLKIRKVVLDSFENEFQFAMVSNWYENQFGKPLALLPDSLLKEKESEEETVNTLEVKYAVPVSGRILEPFETERKGIMIETGIESAIGSVKDGFVVFTGERDNLNRTVIVQHNDGSESWYGKLEEIKVGLYDYIKSGDTIGNASRNDSGENGIFFFALKQGDSFVDPIEVISFD